MSGRVRTRIARRLASMATEIEFGAQSDTGCVRENNEDSYRVAPEMNLFVLSDGMGGLESGEVASRMAVDTVLAHCREAEANPSLPLIGEPIQGIGSASNRLASAIRLANEVGLPRRATGRWAARHGRDDRCREIFGRAHERGARRRQPHLPPARGKIRAAHARPFVCRRAGTRTGK